MLAVGLGLLITGLLIARLVTALTLLIARLVTALTLLVTTLAGLITTLTMVSTLSGLITFLLLITFGLSSRFISLLRLMGAVFYFFIAGAFNVLLKIASAFADSRPFGLFQIVVHRF